MLLVDYLLLDVLFYQKGKQKNPKFFDHSNLDSLVPKAKLIILLLTLLSRWIIELDVTSEGGIREEVS